MTPDLDKDRFVALYGGVYEHSPWIAERAYEAGLGQECESAEGLSRAFRAVVEAAGDDRRLELLRAHPDLAGRLAVAGGLTEESTSEQAAAGLGHCTAEQFARFRSLNDAYKDKFGFPFILAVRGYDREQILEIFQRRVDDGHEAEMAEALEQVHRIALLRLIALTAKDGATR